MCSLGLLCENCVSRTHKKSQTLTNPKPKPKIQDMAFPGPQETFLYILASLAISNGREKGHDLQQSSMKHETAGSQILHCWPVDKFLKSGVKRSKGGDTMPLMNFVFLHTFRVLCFQLFIISFLLAPGSPTLYLPAIPPCVLLSPYLLVVLCLSSIYV